MGRFAQHGGVVAVLSAAALAVANPAGPRPALTPAPRPAAAMAAVRLTSAGSPTTPVVTVTPSAVRVPVGQSVTLTAAAPTVTRPWYQFWMRTPSGSWQLLAGYQPGNTVTVALTTPGPYVVVVYAAPASAGPWFWWAARPSAPVWLQATATAPPAPVTLTGTITNGTMTLPVIVSQTANGRTVSVTGLAMLDTGNNGPAVIDGAALQQAGGTPAGTATGVGFGGTFTASLYNGVTIAPQADPQAPFLANQNQVPSGVETVDQAVSGSAVSPFVANVGLPVLDQGTLTIHGATWTWTYTPATP